MIDQFKKSVLIAMMSTSLFIGACLNSANSNSEESKISSVADLSSVLQNSSFAGMSSVGLSIETESSAIMSSASILSSSTLSSIAFGSSSSGAITYGTLIDSRDGKSYKTVVIGTQVWMAENLNYGTYINDGNSSLALQNGAQKFCYNNIESNCTSDGGLYQWHTAMNVASTCASTSCGDQIATQHKGICPTGWHIPNYADWNILQNILGGSTVAGSKMKLNNTSDTSWNNSTHNNGNSSGFSAFPSGFRSGNAVFSSHGRFTYFWNNTEHSSARFAYYYFLYNSNSSLNIDSYNKMDGFSVRCVED